MANADVTWAVVEGADGGSITGAGVYTAPSRMGTYRVLATSKAAPAIRAEAMVTVRTDSLKTANGFAIDLSETRFAFTLPIDAGDAPVLVIKGRNTGQSTLELFITGSCNGLSSFGHLVGQLHDTEVRPGDTVFFKPLAEVPRGCGNRYDAGSTVLQKMDLEIRVTDLGSKATNYLSLPMNIVVSRIADTAPGDVAIQGVVRDEAGSPAAGARVRLAYPYGGFSIEVILRDGTFSIPAAKAPFYWLSVDKAGFTPVTLRVDASNLSPSYTLTLKRVPQWTVQAKLLNTLKGKVGFWRSAATKDGARLLLVNGMENWSDPSLKAQSQAVLLDVRTGGVLWTHDLGDQSWTADLADNGAFAVVGNNPPNEPLAPAFIRLLDGANGSVIWTKHLGTPDLPGSRRTDIAQDWTSGLKFSHDGTVILASIGPNLYLLNRVDGSIRWHKTFSADARDPIFTEDDRFVYVAPGGGWARKLSTADGAEVWRQFVGGFAFNNGMDLSPDGKYLCTGTKSGDFTLLNSSDGSIVYQEIGIQGWMGHCRFSPDSQSVLWTLGKWTFALDMRGNLLWIAPSAEEYHFGPGGSWSIWTSHPLSAFYDSGGNWIQDIRQAQPPGQRSFIGYVNPAGDRYVFAWTEFGPGEGTVVEIYSLEVRPPP